MKEKKTYRVVHKAAPAEPWGKPAEEGIVLAAKPGKGMIPAAAFIQWNDYQTWEKCVDLRLGGGSSWDQIRRNMSDKRSVASSDERW